MGYLPQLDSDTGLLPPGRYAADLDEIESRFVSASALSGSSTRARLWKEWAQHRLMVESITGGIARVWLAGSFVSGILDPHDIDVTYLLRADVHDGLDEESVQFLDSLTDRSWCVDHDMYVDSYLLRLPDELEFWQLTPTHFTDETNQAFRDSGLYDELWQRTRPSPHGPGQGGKLRRGYVEVLL
ncbi:DUF6932 family protein [Streptomyces demainii]|uniref:Nucleotidyltransferase n=1 Tax=Streptomyces demainii TaxID=588122 RepID=A0ABT9KYJ3_9ACTN|nr:hypothetical protein [Streptomyces demainii]MDP9613518.1 putative nucleotidyltransferase [Streptomyces demainii]